MFVDRRVGLCELVRILKADFHGHEPLRVELARRFPHFGNGDPEAARLALEEFLRIWPDADPDIPEVIDAKRRLAAMD